MNHSALLDQANKAISKPLSQTIIASSLMIASTFLRIGGPVPQTLQTLALAWICLQFSPRIAYVATFAAILAYTTVIFTCVSWFFGGHPYLASCKIPIISISYVAIRRPNTYFFHCLFSL